MPKKVSEQISQYIRELVYSGVDSELAKNFGEYLIALDSLATKIDKLSQKNVKLTGEQVRSLQKDYNIVMEAGDDLARGTEEEYDSHRKAIKHVVSKINKTLAGEVTELSKVLDSDKKSLHDISENANSIHVDITGKDVSFVGGMQSARMPLTYKDENGNEVAGYFTQTTAFDYDKEYEALFEKCSGGNPLYMQAFKAMAEKEDIHKIYRYGKYSQAYIEKIDKVNSVENLKGMFRTELNRISRGKGIFDKLNNDPKFSLKMLDFVVGYSGITTKKELLTEHAGVKKGSTMEERNAAMSAIADLCGVPEIIARSTKMKVKVGDKELSGVFMEKAKGTDIFKVKNTDIIYGLSDKKTLLHNISKKAMQQLSDLQVLDFICGNVDRHNGNITYIAKADAKKGVILDGIQGIDNDCSFGVIGAKGLINGMNRMVGLKNLHRMSSDMQARIMSLTPEILKSTLRPYNLSEEQINACIDRTKMVQEMIQHHVEYSDSYEAVDKGKWDIYDIENDDKSEYVKRAVLNLPKMVSDYSEKNIVTEARDNKINTLKAEVEKKPLKKNTVVEGEKYFKDNDKLEDAELTKQKDLKYLKEGLKAVKINSLRSSNEFDLVEECFKDIAKTDKELTEKQSSKVMKDFKAKYKVLIKFADEYLEKKANEEKQLLIKGKAPSKLAKSRVNIVEEMKKFAQTRIEVLDYKLEDRKKLIDNAKISLNGNINSAMKMIEKVKKEEPTAENRALVKHLEAKIVTNNSLNKAIDEHDEELAEHDIDDMLSFTKQKKMIKKTQEVVDKTKEANIEKTNVEKSNVEKTNDNPIKEAVVSTMHK